MKSLTIRTYASKGLFVRLAPVVLVVAFFISGSFHATFAQVAPSLNTAQAYAVLAGSTVTNTGSSIVTGDLGVSPGTAVTGFPPGLVLGGTTNAGNAAAAQAQIDNTAAYNYLAGEEVTETLTGEDLGGLTLVPGVYFFKTSAQLTGTLTLNAQGNTSAVWVFQIGSTLTTASNSSVVIENGGQNCNVFWQIGSSATLGTGTSFIGNILADQSITLNTDALLAGSALAQVGAVTLESNTVTVSACAVPPVGPIPPTVGKAFSPATINAGGTSMLTITLSNANSTIATGSAFTDTLPSGVSVTSIVSNSCGGTITAATGGSTVALAAGSIPLDGSCAVTVDVTAPTGGSYINSLAAGALVTSNGSNVAPAVASLTVNAPTLVAPTLGKVFSPATINAGGTSTLTITLSNAGTATANLTAALVDTLPSGVVIASPTSSSTTCGGTLTASAGSSTVTLSPPGASILADSSCTITVSVSASAGGSYINSLAAGALQTNNGSNAAPAIATLTVNTPVATPAPPTLNKAFNPATINPDGPSTLTLTLTNPSTTSADTLSAPLVDTLPSGLVVSSVSASNCGVTPTFATTSGVTTVTLPAGASIPIDGACTVTVNVTASGGGSYVNSLAAGALVTNHGSNAFPAIATLTVSTPYAVTLGKAFSPATIYAGSVSTLTITLANTNPTAASLTAPLTDTLPPGVLVAGSISSTCTAPLSGSNMQRLTRQPRLQPVAFRIPTKMWAWLNAGPSTVSMTGGSIPAKSSCTLTVPVTAPVAGIYFNALAAGALVTSNGNNATPALATLTVIPVIAPKLSKSFSPASITAGQVSTLTITLTNLNGMVAKLTGQFTDYFPGNMVAASTPDASTTCGGGKVTATKGGYDVSLETGASIPANGSCTVTVNVTVASASTNVNSLPVGALQTSNGSNTAPATATLTVIPTIPPTLSKSFSPPTVTAGQVSTLTITLTNPNSTVAKLTGQLTDYFPGNMVIASTPDASTTCGGGKVTATKGAYDVSLETGASIPANGSCTVTVNVTVASASTNVNSLPAGALQTSNGSNTAPAKATLIVNQ